MKRKVSKLLGLLLTFVSLFAILAGCSSNKSSDSGNKKEATAGKTLKVWTFTDDMKKIINDYYKPMHKNLDYKIKVTVIPFENFQTKLDPVLGTNKGPDLIALDASFVRKYVESGKMADLSQVGIKKASKNTSKYVKNMGKDADGKQVAISWQATPGAFYYRASLAKKYLGITSPEQMQERLSDSDGFTKLAEQLKEKSNGSAYMVSSIQDLYEPIIGARKQPWVVDNKFTIDDSLYDLMDMSKEFVQNKLTQNTTGQTSDWFSGMSGDNILGYSLPSWGLFYWLEPNAKSSKTGNDTSGDWRVVTGPWQYSWGGTFLGAVKDSNMEKEAAKISKWVGTNEKFQEKWAKDQNDFVSNNAVVNKIKDNYSSDFLGGQNQYKQFAKSASGINGKIHTKYDQDIQQLFIDNVLSPYSENKVSKKEAIKNFKAAVQNAFPDLEID